MEQINDAPHGATVAGLSRNGRAVPNGCHASGWRKATAALAHAERHALAGERAAVPKSQAFAAAKRVGPQIGLKPGDLLLLDTLGAFTQAQDWEEGRRPIVWASNAYLMERTGFSLSALKRHARRLVEAGVIAFRDSPNGKRWGHRDAAGIIVEAYGFDLSPLAARAEEFTQLFATLEAERAECQRLKRQITITRRTIRARIQIALQEALSGPWQQFETLFHALLSKLPRRNSERAALEGLLSWFTELLQKVETAFLDAHPPVENSAQTEKEAKQKTNEMTPNEIIFDPHIQTTNQLQFVTRTSASMDKSVTRPDENPSSTCAENASKRELRSDNVFTNTDLPIVIKACPEFSAWAHTMGNALGGWQDLNHAATRLGPMIGLSEPVWATAQEKLGNIAATAALALIFEKHCAGEIRSPSGYMRGMLRKAGAGELHLNRSFHGRMNRQVT
ncbi:plasmid replication protein RepC [Salipiger abyssi]|uniref:plasmid replication protein RepC n=1 Tax=Salipiger abyssi TaxID=1250539 RepID=UPI001A8CF1AC|nr:plasmid replication protein RepC [Salipiger abyssi]MBN9887032.1 replication protein C [Salipiger abyssi]